MKLVAFFWNLGLCLFTLYGLGSLWLGLVMTTVTVGYGGVLDHCIAPVYPGLEEIEKNYIALSAAVIAWNSYDIRKECPSGFSDYKLNDIPSFCPVEYDDSYGYYYSSYVQFYATNCAAYPMPEECDAFILEHTLIDRYGEGKVYTCRYRNEQLRGEWQDCGGGIRIRLRDWGDGEVLISNVQSEVPFAQQTGFVDCLDTSAILFPSTLLQENDSKDDDSDGDGSYGGYNENYQYSYADDLYYYDDYNENYRYSYADDWYYTSGGSRTDNNCREDPRACIAYLDPEIEEFALNWNTDTPGFQAAAESLLRRFFGVQYSGETENPFGAPFSMIERKCVGKCQPANPVGRWVSWELFHNVWLGIAYHILFVGEFVGNWGMSRTRSADPFASVSILATLRLILKLLSDPMNHPKMSKGFMDGYIIFDRRGRTLRWCTFLIQLWNTLISLSFLLPYVSTFQYNGELSINIWNMKDVIAIGQGLNAIRSFLMLLYNGYTTASKYYKTRTEVLDSTSATQDLIPECLQDRYEYQEVQERDCSCFLYILSIGPFSIVLIPSLLVGIAAGFALSFLAACWCCMPCACCLAVFGLNSATNDKQSTQGMNIRDDNQSADMKAERHCCCGSSTTKKVVNIPIAQPVNLQQP